MQKIVLRAFVLIGFTIQACAPLAAATLKNEATIAKQDVEQAVGLRGQGRHFVPTRGPNITKNDRTGNLLLAQDYSKPLSSQENRTPKKSAKGTCARCAENLPICIYNATLYSNKKTEALRKRHAVSTCIAVEDKCLKKCK